MTQAAVNNAIVLYRLAVERRDVEEAQRVYFVTEKPVSYTHLDVYKRQHSILQRTTWRGNRAV